MHKAWILPAVWLLLLSCAAGAKAASRNQTEVKVQGIVTCIEPDQCYIEALDHSSGIWVLGSTARVGLGDPAAARGTPGVIMGEPVVFDAHIHPHTGKKFTIEPLELPNIALGGGSGLYPWICDYIQYDEPRWIDKWTCVYGEWAPATGDYNVGLLVTTSGIVRSICESPINGAKWIYIDDDTGVVADFGDKGVLVYTDAELLMGDTVSVTGISSTEPSLDTPSLDTPNRLVRVVRTRDAGDVEVLAHQQGPTFPFSDEFDSPTLDPRWLVIPFNGSVSTTSQPGYLAITIDVGAKSSGINSYPIGPEVVQAVHGDWVIDVRLRAEQFQDAGMKAWILLGFKHSPMDWELRYSKTMQGFLGPWLVRFSYETRSGLPPGTLVWTGTMQWPSDVVVLPADTCYYRLTKIGGQVGIEYSFDGLTYQPGVQFADPDRTDYDYFTLSSFLESGKNTEPFTYYIDYVRFTPIRQPGGQQ